VSIIYNPELTGKPCEDGKQFHTKIPEEMATNLLDMADILDPVLK
jgi:hypothetical protein